MEGLNANERYIDGIRGVLIFENAPIYRGGNGGQQGIYQEVT